MATLVTWEVRTHPGKIDQAEANFIRNMPDTLNYSGCQGIKAYRDKSDPAKLVLVQFWESQDHYNKYVQWRKETGVLGDFLTLCDGPPVLRFFDLIG